MKIFLQELYDEHSLIISVIQKLESIFLDIDFWSDETWNKFQEFTHFIEFYIEQYHHKKEEEILFPQIDLSPIVYQGGHYCTHFYHFHLMYQHYEQSKEILTSAKLALELPVQSENVRKIVQNRSGLLVPLEEHWASGNIIKIFKQQIELKTKNQHDEIFLKKCISFYFGLINQHTEKENKCLFVMADNLLDLETQTKMHLTAKKTFHLDRTTLAKFSDHLNLN
jgi:hemerythrin-like domain-containing protein